MSNDRFIVWANRQWQRYRADGTITDAEQAWLSKHTEVQAGSSLALLKTIMTVVMTVLATVISGSSAMCLLALALDFKNLEAAFLMVFAPSLAIAVLLDQADLKVPAITVGAMGLLGSAVLALLGEAYPLWCVMWFAAAGLFLWRSRSLVQSSLLYVLIMTMVMAVLVRAFEPRDPEELRFLALALGGLQLFPFLASRFYQGSLFFEFRLRKLYRYLAIFVGLGAFFIASVSFDRRVDGTVLTSLWFFALCTSLVVITYRVEDRVGFGMSLAYWIAFLVLKYYDLIYDLLPGAAVTFALGFGLVMLGRVFQRLADSAPPPSIVDDPDRAFLEGEGPLEEPGPSVIVKPKAETDIDSKILDPKASPEATPEQPEPEHSASEHSASEHSASEHSASEHSASDKQSPEDEQK